jgi:tRNA(Arg) A34 adenosine deaminase TadA
MKKKILDNCLKIAVKNNHKHPDYKGYHHFTFIVQSDKLIEWGANRKSQAMTFLGYKKHTKRHSEVDAFLKAKGLLDKNKCFEVVNVRLSKQNEIRISSPCSCCSQFLKNIGCKKIWFTTDMGEFAVL